ncbi:hypothetical protein DFQ30_002933 [Apophysomyces sp. BC1015]|nr:hypothetical protein DFQ30_002933 [Apophysomyces sp. BC1015]
MPSQDDRAEMLAAVAKRKLQKYQSKRAVAGAEQERATNDGLKEKLAKAEEKIRLMEVELDKLQLENKTLHQLLESEVLSDQINLTFADGDTLESYEREERQVDSYC